MEEKKFFSARGSPTIKIPIPKGDLLESLDNINFPSLYKELFEHLRNLDAETPEFDHPNLTDLVRIKNGLKFIGQNTWERKAANNIYFKISKLLNCQIALLTEGYHAFLELASQIASSPKKYLMELAADSGFKNIRILAEANIYKHPKLLKVAELAQVLLGRNQSGVIFVETEETAFTILTLLKKLGPTEIMLSPGSDHLLATYKEHHEQVIKNLQSGQIKFVVAESRLQSLLFKAGASRYIQYSAPKPYLAYQTLSARWENNWNSKIYHLLLEHPLELNEYWNAHYKGQFPSLHKEQKRIQRQQMQHPQLNLTPSSKNKKSKRGDNDQLKLFDN